MHPPGLYVTEPSHMPYVDNTLRLTGHSRLVYYMRHADICYRHYNDPMR